MAHVNTIWYRGGGVLESFLVSVRGIEPPSFAFPTRCSAAELHTDMVSFGLGPENRTRSPRVQGAGRQPEHTQKNWSLVPESNRLARSTKPVHHLLCLRGDIVVLTAGIEPAASRLRGKRSTN